MPSRMNDEAFLYLVYGTSFLMKSHVASSREGDHSRLSCHSLSSFCIKL
jgi:hypothetical protein